MAASGCRLRRILTCESHRPCSWMARNKFQASVTLLLSLPVEWKRFHCLSVCLYALYIFSWLDSTELYCSTMVDNFLKCLSCICNLVSVFDQQRRKGRREEDESGEVIPFDCPSLVPNGWIRFHWLYDVELHKLMDNKRDPQIRWHILLSEKRALHWIMKSPRYLNGLCIEMDLFQGKINCILYFRLLKLNNDCLKIFVLLNCWK